MANEMFVATEFGENTQRKWDHIRLNSPSGDGLRYCSCGCACYCTGECNMAFVGWHSESHFSTESAIAFPEP